MKIQSTWVPQVSCSRGGLQVVVVYRRRRYDMGVLWLRGFYADVRSGYARLHVLLEKENFRWEMYLHGLNYVKTKILSCFFNQLLWIKPPKYHHIAALRCKHRQIWIAMSQCTLFYTLASENCLLFVTETVVMPLLYQEPIHGASTGFRHIYLVSVAKVPCDRPTHPLKWLSDHICQKKKYSLFYFLIKGHSCQLHWQRAEKIIQKATSNQVLSIP